MEIYEIVRGTEVDIEAIAQFQVDMAKESEGACLDIEKVRQGVASAIGDETKGGYVVAKFSGKAIGSLMITKEWSDWNNEWYWWIQSVYVKPEYRKQGVFQAMYDAVKELAIESGIPEIRLYVDELNLDAQQVYAKVGMKKSHYLIYEEHLK